MPEPTCGTEQSRRRRAVLVERRNVGEAFEREGSDPRVVGAIGECECTEVMGIRATRVAAASRDEAEDRQTEPRGFHTVDRDRDIEGLLRDGDGAFVLVRVPLDRGERGERVGDAGQVRDVASPGQPLPKDVASALEIADGSQAFREVRREHIRETSEAETARGDQRALDCLCARAPVAAQPGEAPEIAERKCAVHFDAGRFELLDGHPELFVGRGNLVVDEQPPGPGERLHCGHVRCGVNLVERLLGVREQLHRPHELAARRVRDRQHHFDAREVGEGAVRSIARDCLAPGAADLVVHEVERGSPLV